MENLRIASSIFLVIVLLYLAPMPMEVRPYRGQYVPPTIDDSANPLEFLQGRWVLDAEDCSLPLGKDFDIVIKGLEHLTYRGNTLSRRALIRDIYFVKRGEKLDISLEMRQTQPTPQNGYIRKYLRSEPVYDPAAHEREWRYNFFVVRDDAIRMTTAEIVYADGKTRRNYKEAGYDLYRRCPQASENI